MSDFENEENLEQEDDLQEDATHEEDSTADDEGDASLEDDAGDDVDDVGEDDADEGDDASTDENIDYTYKFNGEVYEFDDRIKELIKTPEQAELVRELVEKADGLSYSKERQQHLYEENQRFQHTEAQRQQAVQQMQAMIQNGDLRSFHKTWGISEDHILQEAMNIMKLREMDPQDRAAYERNLQAQEQNWTLQHQLQQQQQYINNLAVNQRESELQQVLRSDEVAQAAYDFDQRAGRPGAFREEIIKRGRYYAQAEGRDVPPYQLARELLTYMGPVAQRQGATGNQMQRPRVITEGKPTLPKVRGRGGSPVKSSINSLEDLRKLANQMNS